MLAYAPRPDHKTLRPATLGLIVLGHAGLLALVLTARSGVIPVIPFTQTDVTLIEEIKPPKPLPPEPQPSPQPNDSQIDILDPIVPPLPTPGPLFEKLPQPVPQPGPVIGTGTIPLPTPKPLDLLPIVHKGPRFATVGDAVRPPYPDSMRQSGDEASLRLRLTIDERGRVTAVEAVGAANATFLAAARRHILRFWRYQPAMEGSRAVPSVTTVTLKFELGNA